MKRIRQALLVSLLLVCLISNVNAGVGIGKDYLKGDTMIVNPGDEVNYKMYITNTDDSMTQQKIAINVREPLFIKLVNTDNPYIQADIISLPGKTYNFPITLKIKTPMDMQMGQKYKVDVSLMTAAKGGAGQMVSFSNEVVEHFYVQAGPETKQQIDPVEIKTTVIVDKQGNTNFVPTAIVNSANITGTVVVSQFNQTEGTKAEGLVVGNLFTDVFKTPLIVISTVFMICFALLFKDKLRKPRLQNSAVTTAIAGAIVYYLVTKNPATFPYLDALTVAIIFNVELFAFIIMFEGSKDKVVHKKQSLSNVQTEVKKVEVKKTEEAPKLAKQEKVFKQQKIA
jgi:hypothetical protein